MEQLITSNGFPLLKNAGSISHQQMEKHTGELYLTAGDWITQPQDYVTIDLYGLISETVYVGFIPEVEGCSEFTVDKVDK